MLSPGLCCLFSSFSFIAAVVNFMMQGTDVRHVYSIRSRFWAVEISSLFIIKRRLLQIDIGIRRVTVQ